MARRNQSILKTSGIVPVSADSKRLNKGVERFTIFSNKIYTFKLSTSGKSLYRLEYPQTNDPNGKLKSGIHKEKIFLKVEKQGISSYYERQQRFIGKWKRHDDAKVESHNYNKLYELLDESDNIIGYTIEFYYERDKCTEWGHVWFADQERRL